MIRALMYVRFRALMAAMFRQNRTTKKRSGGMTALLIFCYIYLGAAVVGASVLLFSFLAEPYHALGLDWLYFALAGLMALALALIGSVFSTQSQLYDAKDNERLLAMPIPPRAILFSRMAPLLVMNLVFAGIVLIPAMAVYAALVHFSAWALICQILILLGVTALAQAAACLLGWLLHLLLARINKSIASLLFVVLFLAVYYYAFSQSERVLDALSTGGEALAGTLRTWAWPLYAMGRGSLGEAGYLLGFLAVCAALFGLAWWFLSATFLGTVTMGPAVRRRKRLALSKLTVHAPRRAIASKELRRFLGTPVYFANMGLGIVLMVVMTGAAALFQGRIWQMLGELGELAEMGRPYFGLIIAAVLAFWISTMCVSVPSVSLEGKSLWILKSMPVSSRQVLLGKLENHVLLTAPLSAVCGLILGVVFRCPAADCLLAALSAGLGALLCGLLGMVAGLHWARFDYLSEAYPCKQSVAVLVNMFGMMGLPLVLGLAYGFWLSFLNPTVYLALCCGVYALLSMFFYRLLMTWGVKKWESL